MMLLTINSYQDLYTHLTPIRHSKKTLGFVPTMGNLHAGHLQLVKQAKTETDFVVVSIFINPLQFGQNEDFSSYPRTLVRDQELLNTIGCDVLYCPTVVEMYPEDQALHTKVSVPDVIGGLCGLSRPTHFEGVATVVTKLLNMVAPAAVYFGKKDYQQWIVVRKLVRDLSLPINVRGVDTVREKSGLAMSSRNGYLTEVERVQASKLYAILQDVAKHLQETPHQVETCLREGYSKLVDAGFKPDYLEVRESETLAPAHLNSSSWVVLGAVYLGATRLIDNVEIPLKR